MKNIEINTKKSVLVDVSGRIYADDRTDVYVGSCNKIKGRIIDEQAHPDTSGFEFQGDCCDYIYFICWSNDSGYNGFLAEINGTNKVLSGGFGWQVFATGKNKGVLDSVSVDEINAELKRACKQGWKEPFVGQPNDGSNSPFNTISGIDSNANFIWWNKGDDSRAIYPSSPYVPFAGWNHEEFLIFRTPIALLSPSCGEIECEECECETCEEVLANVEDIITERCDSLVNSLAHCDNDSQGENCDCSDNTDCTPVDLSVIQPCISIHWGDSDCDAMETEDFEVMCITVCNCYTNLFFNNFSITMLEIVDQNGNPVPKLPDGTPSVQIFPIGPHCFGDIPPCGGEKPNCVSREFVVKTCGAIAGDYEIRLSGICFDVNAHINNNDCLKLKLCTS